MTATEKRKKVVDAVKSREGKNTYTQSTRRTQVASGYGDCSSTMEWAYNQIGIEIGSYTEAQILSKAAKDVPLKITNGIPDESMMRPGDLLYFRGASLTHQNRYKNVGHVEMYVGSGQISGHPSGIGPTRKDMKDYCTRMQSRSSSYATPKNCGLICVRRVIQDDPVASPSPVPSRTGAIAKGAKVAFSGTRHYGSSDGSNAATCSPCQAQVTAVATGAKYPYHLEGSSVHGWVAASDVAPLREGQIVCTSLHIRQKPDNTSASLGIMKHGDKITITGNPVNGWVPILWNGIAGYAKNRADYLKAS